MGHSIHGPFNSPRYPDTEKKKHDTLANDEDWNFHGRSEPWGKIAARNNALDATPLKKKCLAAA